jgi:hypothetical protein
MNASHGKPFLATEEDRRWSNTYLHVSLIEDPQRKLRMLRVMLAGELWHHRAQRHAYRIRANDDIDIGWTASARTYSALITQENAVIDALRRVAKELR